MHAGSAVFKTQSEAVVLLPGKQHEWKEAQEVRNGSFASVWPCFIHFRSSPSKPGRMLKGALADLGCVRASGDSLRAERCAINSIVKNCAVDPD